MIKSLRVILLVVVGLGFSQLHAQTVASNKLLVSLKPGVEAGIFREQLGISTSQWQTIDSEFRLYAIQFLSQADAHAKLLAIAKTGKCAAYQHVHEVKNRGVVPNDKYLTQQKYLTISRTADAWAYLRNGVDRQGDTLVVAIVDSGMDTMHPDLFGNRWVNRQEIPNNRIDDDLNGYIDDVYGWNGGDDNNKTYTSVSLDGHGTAIAGIVGAVGNNTEGIAGINWKIKLMPIVCYASKGAGDDIGVVRSLIYAYKMKKLYLSSGGKKGANITAVNTSIGIDLAFPEDAPVWCSLYDSLGKVGVFSSAATTNNDIDVAVKGDIPSTCPSKFMVVVGSTNFNDQRASSGFSTKFVDMMAMGENVYTTGLVKNAGADGPYNSVSGTSFAAPQIAAVIGLLYQHVCDTFLKLTREEPDSAVSLLVKWMFDGTDKIAGLNTKCFTGGRLNAYKTWQQMDLWCSSHDIPYSIKPFSQSDWLVYPDPAASGDKLHLEFGNHSVSGVMRLLNAEGQVLLVEDFENRTEVEWTLPLLSSGLYFVEITSQNQRLVRKLLIH